MNQIDPATVEQEILSRLDPKGEMTDLMDTLTRLIDSHAGWGIIVPAQASSATDHRP